MYHKLGTRTYLRVLKLLIDKTCAFIIVFLQTHKPLKRILITRVYMLIFEKNWAAKFFSITATWLRDLIFKAKSALSIRTHSFIDGDWVAMQGFSVLPKDGAYAGSDSQEHSMLGLFVPFPCCLCTFSSFKRHTSLTGFLLKFDALPFAVSATQLKDFYPNRHQQPCDRNLGQ